MKRIVAIAVVLFAGLGIAAQSFAQEQASEASTTRHRWSDGPRNVPVPRGRSLARAQALGLGSLDTAHELLRVPPRESWVEATRNRVPRNLLWPVTSGRWGRGFGYVRTTEPDKRHNGIDIGAPEGDVVRAAADGIVAYSDNGLRGYGNCVLIVHPNGWVTLYGHNSRNTVQPGWRVQRGERVALVGHTGHAQGPHLHFELRIDGEPVDPVSYLADHDVLPGWVRETLPEREERELVAEASDDNAELATAPTSDEVEAGGAAEVPVGSVAAVRRLIRRPPSEDTLATFGGRLFRTLLFPVRESSSVNPVRPDRELRIPAAEGSAIRAAADGLIVFADENFPGLGRTVVMLHRNGWVTMYGGVEELHVRAGDQVQRGEWIARIGGQPALAFRLYENGRPVDPTPRLVQIPVQPTDG